MTVLDAYAVLAYLRDEPSAGEVQELFAGPTLLTTVNAAEVVDRLVRVHGHDPDDVDADLMLLVHAGMEVVALGEDGGLRAGRLRAHHYHRTECAVRVVSLADCVAATAALTNQMPLATSDPALAAVVRAEGGHVHPLVDTRGQAP